MTTPPEKPKLKPQTPPPEAKDMPHLELPPSSDRKEHKQITAQFEKQHKGALSQQNVTAVINALVALGYAVVESTPKNKCCVIS